MAKKKKLIKPSVLTDDEKINKLIGKNKLSSQITDDYEIYKENRYLGFKGRKMQNGGGSWMWDMAYRPNGQDPVHIIAENKRNGKFLLVFRWHAN